MRFTRLICDLHDFSSQSTAIAAELFPMIVVSRGHAFACRHLETVVSRRVKRTMKMFVCVFSDIGQYLCLSALATKQEKYPLIDPRHRLVSIFPVCCCPAHLPQWDLHHERRLSSLTGGPYRVGCKVKSSSSIPQSAECLTRSHRERWIDFDRFPRSLRI